jgi:chemotaxis protein histidine kinase CheA/CheY-like chemotaxis protein
MQPPRSKELWAVFLSEAAELIDELANRVESLRRVSGSEREGAIRDSMRHAHNLKGASVSVDAIDISCLAHAVEDSLVDLNTATGAVDEGVIIDGILRDVVFMQRLLEGGDVQDSAMKERLAALRAETTDKTSAAMPRDSQAQGPSMLRVEAKRLDRLMGFIGDMFLARSRFANRYQLLERFQDELFHEFQQLPAFRSRGSRLTRQLETLIDDTRRDYQHFAALTDKMSASMRNVRMIPLEVAASGWRQVVRDAAQRLCKKVDVVVSVGDLEIDKAVLDRLYDPVNHLLRNAVDHGVESEEERVASGKPKAGRIEVRAESRGSMVRLTVEDDGRGLDTARIADHALKSGLRPAAQLSEMAESEIVDLVFQPGFSTRSEASEVSGRGVGLDIVRRHLEQVGGRAAVDLRPGTQGTRFALHIPVSVISTHGLLVRASEEVFALPLDHVERTVRLHSDFVRQSEGSPVVSLGDSQPLRLRWLASLFGGVDSRRLEREITLVVLSNGSSKLGLVVDEVIGCFEFVTRPLPWNLRPFAGVNGVAFLEDGSIALTLDVPAFFTHIIRDSRGRRDTLQRRPTILVVDDSISIRTLHKSILSGAGYDVILASDGDEAWDVLAQKSVDLVVADILMPGLDGFELTRRIRAEPRLRQLPVILVTTMGEPDDLARGAEAGANEYIVKSHFKQKDLLAAVATYV